MNILLLTLFASTVYGAALPGVPDELTDLLPPELRAFLERLTEEEKTALKEAAKIIDEEKAIAHLKEKSPKLGEKAEKLYKVYTTKLASLQDEKAKAFANEVINSAKKVQREFIIGDKINIVQLKKTAKYTFEQFNELPTESKEELNKTFPKLIAFFQNKKFLTLIGEN